MSGDTFELLAPSASLAGTDLAEIYRMAKETPAMPENLARFKKKEPVENMAKSILKHRILALTGKNFATIETEMGYNTLDGKTLDVDTLRKLAHFLILEANGKLVHLPAVDEDRHNGSGGKRKMKEELEETTMGSARKRTRKSMIPRIQEDMMDTSLPAAKKGRMSLGARRTPLKVSTPKKEAPKIVIEEEEEEDEEEEDPNLGLENPTPAMLMLKRRSIAAGRSKTPVKAPAPKTPVKAVAVKPERKKQAPPPVHGFPGAKFETEDGSRQQCEIFLVEGDPTASVSLKAIKTTVPSFPGAHLSVIHTPVDWEPTHIFSIVQKIRTMNSQANLQQFLVLVGCGLPNVHMFHEALMRQTKHVQFLVFERKDIADPEDGKLVETTSYFLLAYFFPGCTKAGSRPPTRMVRQGLTTSFRTENIEDLENTIVHAMTVEGDWILDLCCKGRELILAAQKTGRFAVAMDPNVDKLEGLVEKARAIAKVENDFRDVDGVILKVA